jgi:hypothetical protein
MFTSLGHIPLDVLWTFSITQECLCEHTKHKVVSSVVDNCNCQITPQSGSWIVLTQVPSQFSPYFQVPAEVPLFHFIIHYCPQITNNVTQTLQLLHHYPITNIIKESILLGCDAMWNELWRGLLPSYWWSSNLYGILSYKTWIFIDCAVQTSDAAKLITVRTDVRLIWKDDVLRCVMTIQMQYVFPWYGRGKNEKSCVLLTGVSLQ